MSVQTEDALKEVGKTAALVEDGSPLQLGTTGTIDGKTFKIVGRIQYQFGLGFWNEWYISIDSDDAWLGEASGLYFYTRLKKDAKIPENLEFANLYAGAPVTIDGKEFFVKDMQTSKVVSGEGELPFPFETAYEAPVVDLVRHDGTFATIDFSEDGSTGLTAGAPLVFIGRPLLFSDLNLTRIRSVYGFKASAAEVAS